MQLFVSGTDTNIGKTVVCSWLCLHTGYSYFKPIQTGSREGCDVAIVSGVTTVPIYPESYRYKNPLSPHLAAAIENEEIDISTIQLPNRDNLIVEGAGGLLVPINKRHYMIDLMQKLRIPVIIVAGSQLGTINHTLLSLEALKRRSLPTLGVIISGTPNKATCEAIAYYGEVAILAELPWLTAINRDNLRAFPLTTKLKSYLL